MTITEAREKLIKVARQEIGYHEGANNYIKYATGTWDNTFYGWELQNQPWCDVFVDWCFCTAFGIDNGANMTYQKVGNGSALCSASAQFYKSNNAFFNYPEIGDQIFFYVNGGINHTGIVETVTSSGNNWTSITTIEGNSSDSVARRTYNKSNKTIAGFGRPKWSLVSNIDKNETIKPIIPTESASTTILRKGSKGINVRQLQEKLISLGYDCGPDGADGDFGKNTYETVKKFQIDYKIQPIDGEVGPITLAALNKVVSKSEPIAKNDIVIFNGNMCYNTAVATTGVTTKPGKARVTLISNNSNAKHPYHIIHIDNSSNVYGWVDKDTIKKE